MAAEGDQHAAHALRMNPEQWPRLEELFHRAAELQEAERAAFLDAECAGPEMRAEVESLLAHDASPGAGFQDALALEAEATAAENSEWLIGRHIGPYRVTGIIGEGGMGAVYSAIRDDDHYHKEVAIKLVRHGLESSKLLERFRAERQILATLEHPYVARMLDGGATADGFPYLVMERIKGLPITRYAQERRLSIETRLRLFLQVCEAVQYAHANLIVHRDIKPANISVTADGVPKLLDFGIARLLTPDRLQSGEQATSTLLLTPDYASPEQVRGQVVTTATDIYSLGAVLYELLTGHSPHRLAGRSSAEALSSICTEEPEVPSKAAEPSIASARQLAGDLDNIVLMALRKEPERRYRSVEQFCEDIQRHLAGRPVIARADTLAYRAARFAGRNRWAIAAVTAVMVTLASSVVVSRRAAERAERRFAQVRHLAETVLFEIYESIEPLAGSTPSRQIIVKNALEYLRSLSAEAASDASLLNELAEAYRKVGDVQSNEFGGNLGDARGAMESYHNGVALARSAVAAQPGNASFQATLGTLLWSLSRRQFDSSEMDAARRSGEEAIRLLERSTARDSSDATALEALGQAHLFLGAFSGKAGDPARVDPGEFLNYSNEMGKARQAFERAIEIRETIVRDFPDKAAYRRGLMVNYANLADTINDVCFAPKPDPEGTRPYYQKVVAIAQSLAAADPKNHMAQMDLAQSFFRMGCLEEATSHMSAAVGQYRQALAITRAAAGVPDAARSTLILHVSVLQRLGKVLISQGQVREAVDGYGNAFQVVKGLARREPGSTEILGRVVASSGVLAGGLGQAGSRDALDDLARKIEPEIERAGRSTLPPLMRPYPAIAMLRFGEAYTLLHDKPSACKWLQRSAGAWTQVESNGGITPDREPLHAGTLRLLASCTAAPGPVERPSRINQDRVSDLSQPSRNSR